MTQPSAGPPTTVLLIAGDLGGYLAPCGCTKPMSGGIRRLATAVKDLGPKNRTVFLATGSLVGKATRQDELKAETIAEALNACGVDALGLTSQDLALGEAMIGSIDRLSGNRVLSGAAGTPTSREVPPLLVGVGLPGTAEHSARSLAAQAEQSRLTPVLLLDGGIDAARKLAEAVPGLGLIVYRHAGSASERPILVGNCRLVTPGNRGKALLRIEWTGREFQGFGAVDLGPSFADDEQVSRLYATYLRRVAGEKLLEKLPRTASDPFAGNQTCGSCHRSAEAIWKESRHAGALKTLEQDNHDRDPDCTGCHVVGLDLAEGFRSRAETPQLTDVGCESCHGPGLSHAKEPYAIKMPKVGAKSCAPCHVPDHSPGFDYETYWAKIRH